MDVFEGLNQKEHHQFGGSHLKQTQVGDVPGQISQKKDNVIHFPFVFLRVFLWFLSVCCRLSLAFVFVSWVHFLWVPIGFVALGFLSHPLLTTARAHFSTQKKKKKKEGPAPTHA